MIAAGNVVDVDLARAANLGLDVGRKNLVGIAITYQDGNRTPSHSVRRFVGQAACRERALRSGEPRGDIRRFGRCKHRPEVFGIELQVCIIAAGRGEGYRNREIRRWRRSAREL